MARFFNIVGARQVGDYGMVLLRFVGAALTGKPLRVHGQGKQSRCFCDVSDVVETMPKLLASPGCRGEVFNIGSDRSITIRELAELVIRETGSRSMIEFVPYSEAYPSGFEDLADRRPDLTKIRNAIGFSSTKSLEQTIRDVAGWLSSSEATALREGRER